MKQLFKTISTTGFFIVFLLNTLSANAFVLKKIRVEGLQRIRLETVLNYLHVNEGDNLKQGDTVNIIDSLYQTDFFDNIKLFQEGSTLVIKVEERPVITSVNFSGNKVIPKDKFEEVLKEQGLSEGAVYNESKLIGIKHALEGQYEVLGRFDASVTVKVEEKPRNRVAISININEGNTAKIKHIKVSGNQSFSDKTVLNQFKLTKSKPWSLLFHNDVYSRERLDQDLDRLRDFYMDRGYLKYKLVTEDVKLSDNKREVFINITIHEGPVYTFAGYKLTGELIIPSSSIDKLIHVKKGDIFSRSDMINAHKDIAEIYANEGYAQVHTDIIPTLDEKLHTVFIEFNIVPGKPTYVRRVEFKGNTRTHDEVLRRELRQFEGALYSKSKVQESKRRLNNLGYLEKVDVQTTTVPQSSNEVDVQYIVSEASTATARAQVGYSDAVGFLYGASINQKNFMGTGRSVGVNFEQNDAFRTYKFDYFNPYYTISGVGRGFNLFSTKTTPGRIGIAAFTTDSYGGSMNYSIPISAYNHFSAGLGYSHMNIYINKEKTSKEILSFIEAYGDEYDQFTLNFGWTHSTYDRAIFPTDGFKHAWTLALGVPATRNSLEYYKLTYIASYYHQIYGDFIFHSRAKLGYGDGYSRTNDFPFFLNYYGGGIDTVRGLDDNTLGPKDSNNMPLGGNIITAGSLELIFPNPLGERVRSFAFVDVGNVFGNSFDIRDMHITSGVEVDWISPFGPLQLSLAYPLNNIQNDNNKKAFQFSLGASF